LKNGECLVDIPQFFVEQPEQLKSPGGAARVVMEQVMDFFDLEPEPAQTNHLAGAPHDFFVIHAVAAPGAAHREQ
jgi:hypothetical protein